MKTYTLDLESKSIIKLNVSKKLDRRFSTLCFRLNVQALPNRTVVTISKLIKNRQKIYQKMSKGKKQRENFSKKRKENRRKQS